jgi:glutamate formiminotransferase/formiminotetrahydrofolate cyclodeaminase
MDFDKTSFADLLTAFASDAPTPGGGSAAALAGAMGAALAEMVASLTLSKEKYAASHEAVRPIAGLARRTRQELQRLAHEDSEAYDAVVAARRLLKDTPDQEKVRARKTSEANRLAAEVPMRTARSAFRLLGAMPDLAKKGNPNAASDAGAAALLLEAATHAALLNVAINLGGIDDAAFAADLKAESQRLSEEAVRIRERALSTVRSAF